MRYSSGGEIFTKLLPSVKITDLIAVLKSKFNASNPVREIGIRPGEKIHEILISDSEILRTYEYKNNLIVIPSLENWLQNCPEVPVYIKEGNPVALNKEVSSKDYVVDPSFIPVLIKNVQY